MSNVTQLQPRAKPMDEVRAAVQAIIDSNECSMRSVATLSGMGLTRLSMFLRDKYTGDNEAIALTLQRWLDQREKRSTHNSTLPQVPDFVPTPTTNRILDALTYAQLAGDITVIYGGAGVGKTKSAQHYAASENNVWIATLTPSSASVSGVLEEISISVGVKNPSSRSSAARRDIVERLRNTGGLLIIDEAQHASVTALDEIRSIHDTTGVGIALVGNEAVYGRMTGGNRAAYLDRLFSRIGKRVKVRSILKSDTVGLAAAWGVTDKESVDLLAAIGNKPGALRAVTKTLRLASMFASGAGEEGISATHIKAAFDDLGGSE